MLDKVPSQNTTLEMLTGMVINVSFTKAFSKHADMLWKVVKSMGSQMLFPLLLKQVSVADATYKIIDKNSIECASL